MASALFGGMTLKFAILLHAVCLARFYLDVKDAGGAVTNWEFELGVRFADGRTVNAGSSADTGYAMDK